MKFSYEKGEPPDGYRCARCGAVNCRLWRPYQSFHIELLCADCGEADQNKKLEEEAPFEIGWMVAAVPTEDDGAGVYWGYTSVPQAGIKWWLGLPERPVSPRDWSPRKKA